VKKEIKDELTHVLYDQTRRTPIVIPVINEIGGGGGGGQKAEGENRGHQPRQQQGRNGGPNQNRSYDNNEHVGLPPRNEAPQDPAAAPAVEALGLETKSFPAPMVPDTEANEPKKAPDVRGY
jgi:hypothetical protein